MSKHLGVFVTSDSHLDKLIKLCEAAKKKDVEVTVFFSHLGTLLTHNPRFGELEGLAKMSLSAGKFPPSSGSSASIMTLLVHTPLEFS